MTEEQECCFGHERLNVYQEAIGFNAWLATILEDCGRIGEQKDQLDRAASSIALNIAEGNGKYSSKDRCRFFDTAHGSALECAAGLDVLVARQKVTNQRIQPGKSHLHKIVRMLIGLIKRHNTREYRDGKSTP